MVPRVSKLVYAPSKKPSLPSTQRCQSKVWPNHSFEPTPNSVAPPAGTARFAQFAVPARGATLPGSAQFERWAPQQQQMPRRVQQLGRNQSYQCASARTRSLRFGFRASSKNQTQQSMRPPHHAPVRQRKRRNQMCGPGLCQVERCKVRRWLALRAAVLRRAVRRWSPLPSIILAAARLSGTPRAAVISGAQSVKVGLCSKQEDLIAINPSGASLNE